MLYVFFCHTYKLFIYIIIVNQKKKKKYIYTFHSPYNQPNSNINYKQLTQNSVYGNLNKSNGHHHHDHVVDEDEEIKIEIEHDNLNNIIHNINDIKLNDYHHNHHQHQHQLQHQEQQHENESAASVVVAEEPASVLVQTTHIEKPTYFHLSKQHTGLKNISFNVGAAVSPTDKMEFNQMEPESFGLLKINRPLPSPLPTWQQSQPQSQQQKHHQTLPITSTLSPNNIDNTDAVSMVSSEGFTEQGYFDLKFYHNKLW